MQIAPTTHEHATTARVYTYQGEYEVADDAIVWHADVRHGEGGEQRFEGSIPLGSPALPTLAEQAVRDAIVKRIDSFVDRQNA